MAIKLKMFSRNKNHDDIFLNDQVNNKKKRGALHSIEAF